MKHVDASGSKFVYQRCSLCDTKTPWYCLGCKLPLCLEQDRHELLEERIAAGEMAAFLTPDELEAPLLKEKGVSENGTSTEGFFRWSCFHVKHQCQIGETMADMNNWADCRATV